MSNVRVLNFPKNGIGTAMSLPQFQPIMQGAKGAIVTGLQTWLHKHGFTPGAIDGIYGSNTAGAVKALQQTLGVARSGNFDQATVAAVNADLASQTSKLNILEEQNLTRPMPSSGSATSTAIVPTSDAAPAQGMSTELKIGLGLGGLGLALLGWMALSDRKRSAAPIAGENFLNDLGREDEGGEDDGDLPPDFYEKVMTKAEMKSMMEDYSRRLAERLEHMLETRDNGGRRTSRAPGVEGIEMDGMKWRDVQKQIKALGMTVKKTDGGDIRVAFKGKNAEASAYYTNSATDALATAKDMMRRRNDDESSFANKPVGDASPDTPKGKMQACARQWQTTTDKEGTTYRLFMKSCMKGQ